MMTAGCPRKHRVLCPGSLSRSFSARSSDGSSPPFRRTHRSELLGRVLLELVKMAIAPLDFFARSSSPASPISRKPAASAGLG